MHGCIHFKKSINDYMRMTKNLLSIGLVYQVIKSLSNKLILEVGCLSMHNCVVQYMIRKKCNSSIYKNLLKWTLLKYKLYFSKYFKSSINKKMSELTEYLLDN